MSREKLDFYAKVGTREVLILDRDPWSLELYALRRDRMHFKAKTVPGGEPITSGVVSSLAGLSSPL